MGRSAWRLSGYRVEQLLGSGASGDVWLGRVNATGVPVALKRVWLSNPAQRKAALSEAAMLSALDHPHLMKLHELRADDDAIVLVLDLAGGGSLASLLARRGRLTVGETITAIAPIAAALAYAHHGGVVHGDVSAANVLFTDIGLPLLADLGVARLRGDSAPVRTTPAYADPFVAAGSLPAPASDVFMLGGVALHALTGSPPWSGSVPADVLDDAASGEQPNFAARLAAAGVPAETAFIVARALTVEPALRGTAADFALDLRHSGQPVAVELYAGRQRVAPTLRSTLGATDFGRSSWTRSSSAGSAAVGGSAVRESAVRGSAVRGDLPADGDRAPDHDRAVDHDRADDGDRVDDGDRATGGDRITDGDRVIPAFDVSAPDGSAPVDVAVPADAPAPVGLADGDGAAGDGAPAVNESPPVDDPVPVDDGVPVDDPVPVDDGMPADVVAGRPPLTAGVRAPSPFVSTAPGRHFARSRPRIATGFALSAALAALLAAISIWWWPFGDGHHSSTALPHASSADHVVPRSAALSTTPDAPGRTTRTAAKPTPSEGAGLAAPLTAAQAKTVLAGLDATRAAAFAARDPARLAAVYSSATLLARDRALLAAIVPTGCGLRGIHTVFSHVVVTKRSADRVRLQLRAELGPSTLMCGGTASGRAAGSPSTPVTIVLVRKGVSYRIADQRTL